MTAWVCRARPIWLLALGWCILASTPTTSAAAAPPPGDAFLEGYAAAVLQREFGMTGAVVTVSSGVVSVRAEDLKDVDRERVLAALSGIPGVVAVRVVETPTAAPPTVGTSPPTETEPPATAPGPEKLATGFLKAGRLFDPLIADPRWPHFSASYQYYIDDPQFENVGAASFGESFSLYRGDGPFGGQWEVGLQAAVFAIFDLDGESTDLINADYYVALTGSYRHGGWQALARFFHQSSHLGDEFLLSSRIERVNLSYEGIGLLVSRYLLDDAIRLYGGGSVLVRREPGSLKPGAIEYGLELRSPWYLARGIRPVAALDLQNRQQNNWAIDLSARAGLEFGGVQVLGRKLLVALEYFDGHSPNGQFYRDRVNYFGIGLHLY
jgi:hypothetical protein